MKDLPCCRAVRVVVLPALALPVRALTTRSAQQALSFAAAICIDRPPITESLCVCCSCVCSWKEINRKERKLPVRALVRSIRSGKANVKGKEQSRPGWCVACVDRFLFLFFARQDVQWMEIVRAAPSCQGRARILETWTFAGMENRSVRSRTQLRSTSTRSTTTR